MAEFADVVPEQTPVDLVLVGDAVLQILDDDALADGRDHRLGAGALALGAAGGTPERLGQPVLRGDIRNDPDDRAVAAEGGEPGVEHDFDAPPVPGDHGVFEGQMLLSLQVHPVAVADLLLRVRGDHRKEVEPRRHQRRAGVPQEILAAVVGVDDAPGFEVQHEDHVRGLLGKVAVLPDPAAQFVDLRALALNLHRKITGQRCWL
jgi:hypothetical protein